MLELCVVHLGADAETGGVHGKPNASKLGVQCRQLAVCGGFQLRKLAS